ncbi:MAG: transposase [Candidatus Edwardsbacteria bacterium]
MTKRKLTAQEKLQIVLESLKGNINNSELCRQYDVWPTELHRFKQRALQGALEALNSHKGKKDTEKEILKSKIERLKEIITTQASEIDLLKKRTNSDY